MRILIENCWPVRLFKKIVKNNRFYKAIAQILKNSLEKALEITIGILLIAVIFGPRDPSGLLYFMNIPVLSIIKETGDIVFEFILLEGTAYFFVTSVIISSLYYIKKSYI